MRPLQYWQPWVEFMKNPGGQQIGYESGTIRPLHSVPEGD